MGYYKQNDHVNPHEIWAWDDISIHKVNVFGAYKNVTTKLEQWHPSC